jgi:hypothetical protein
MGFFYFNIEEKIFRGIDNDEAVFLEFASKQQAEIDGRRFAVTSEVKEFRVSFFTMKTSNLKCYYSGRRAKKDEGP